MAERELGDQATGRELTDISIAPVYQRNTQTTQLLRVVTQ
jgi:hypothetical protein